MNPFDTLLDGQILHIFSFLPGKDLLKLPEMNHKFNKIITQSEETMANIRLVLDFKKGVNLDGIIELVGRRRFTALKLVGIDCAIAEEIVFPSKFFSLMKLLRDSVEDLIIENCEIGEAEFGLLVLQFLRNVKKFALKEVFTRFTSGGCFCLRKISLPLATLKVEDSCAEIFKYFACCKKIESFEFHQGMNFVMLNGFLAQQTQLRQLIFNRTRHDLDQWACFQLEELTLTCDVEGIDPYDDAMFVPKFLTKLPNLKKLYLDICGYVAPRQTLEAICNAPKLDHLTLNILEGIFDEGAHDDQEELANYTVKKLRIYDEMDVTAKLLKMFRGVEFVGLKLTSNQLDLSEVPCEQIEKIKIVGSRSQLHVKFSPIDVPEIVEIFESTVLNFTEKHSTRIQSISIGCKEWLDDEEFGLSNSFWQRLSLNTPELKLLEVYNIKDRG